MNHKNILSNGSLPQPNTSEANASTVKLNPFPDLRPEKVLRRRIDWTEREIEAVTKELVAFRLADPFGSLTELAARAQEGALPEDRRRRFPTLPKNLRRRFTECWSAAVQKDTTEDEPVILTGRSLKAGRLRRGPGQR